MYIKYGNDGLIPVVAQDNSSGEVLMVAYMNEAALNKTIETGLVHYYSRTRRSLWLKGETSGHFQHVVDIMVDCDQDTLLVKVNQDGCACHTGNKTCFYRKIDSDISSSSAMVKEDSESYQSAVAASAADSNVLNEVFKIINDRKASPREGSYTTLLFQKGLDKILKKIGEESAEVIIAAKNRNNDEIRYETADLIYHLMVMMADAGLAWEDIFAELKSRN